MAKRFLTIAAIVAIASPAGGTPEGGSVQGRRLVLDRVPLSVAAEALVRHVSSKPFMLCDTVLNDQRLTSIRLEPFQLRYDVIAQILGGYGYRLTNKNGVVHVCDNSSRAPVAATVATTTVQKTMPARLPPSAPPPAPISQTYEREAVPVAGIASPILAHPLIPPAARPEEQVAPLYAGPTELMGYRPSYVSPSALRATVEPIFKDLTFTIVESNGQRPALFARGPVSSTGELDKMLKFLDVEATGIEVQAIILEVATSEKSGFGVSVILDALRSGVGIDLDGGDLQNKLTFRSGSFDAVLSAVSSNGQTKVISSPRLSGRCGEKLRLQVGDDVPTLGSVVENPSGSTAQNIQYRESGVIFDVLPECLQERISVKLRQEISNFVVTETGVRGSPTLQTRSLDSVLDLADGEWAIAGGLKSIDTARSKQSLFRIVPIGKTKTKRESELVMLLNVRKEPAR